MLLQQSVFQDVSMMSVTVGNSAAVFFGDKDPLDDR